MGWIAERSDGQLKWPANIWIANEFKGKKAPKKSIHHFFFLQIDRWLVMSIYERKPTSREIERKKGRFFSTCTFLFQFSKRSDRLTQALNQTPLLHGYMEPLTLWTVHMQTIHPIIPLQFFCPSRGEGWRKARRGSGKKDWGEKENKSVIKNAGVTGGG